MIENVSPAISFNLHKKDPLHIDNNKSYTELYPQISQPTHNPKRSRPIKPFQAAWNPDNFIYTDGSQKTVNPTLGASIINPLARTTTHIEIKSKPERHTINRAELAAITMILEFYKEQPQIHILAENAFNINTLRNYTIDHSTMPTKLTLNFSDTPTT